MVDQVTSSVQAFYSAAVLQHLLRHFLKVHLTISFITQRPVGIHGQQQVHRLAVVLQRKLLYLEMKKWCPTSTTWKWLSEFKQQTQSTNRVAGLQTPHHEILSTGQTEVFLRPVKGRCTATPWSSREGGAPLNTHTLCR